MADSRLKHQQPIDGAGEEFLPGPGRLQQQLRDLEQLYRQVTDAVREAVLTTDSQGKILSVNPAAEKMFGYAAVEILGHNLGILMPAHLRKVQAAMLKARLRAGEQPPAWSPVRMRGLHKGGNELALEINLGGHSKGGERLFTGVVRDVTESEQAEDALRRSEERYRALFEDAVHGMYRCSVGGRFLDANAALVKMLGYDSREQVLALDLARDLYAYPEERAALLEQCQHAASTEAEVTWVRRGGGCIVVRISGHSTGGEPPEFEAIVEDITERKNLEEQLRQSQKAEAVGQLAGGIAHDFNNIINIITGYCELLSREFSGDDSLKQKVAEIHAAAQRAISLTRPLLAFSRRQAPDAQVLNVNHTVWETHKLLRRLIPTTIDLVPLLDADLGRVRVDPSQLQQVLMNLVVNARDAIPVSGKIVVQTANMDVDRWDADGIPPPGSYVRFSVSDNGCGMTDETRAHVFEPFFTTKEKGKGTGLGLATVQGIVRQNRGFIRVESVPGEGSVFHIFFPRLDDEDRPEPGKRPLDALGGTETILVADDELAIRKMVCASLKKLGYSVLSARDGEEAIKISQEYEGPIHLLVADVIMPKANGLEAWKAIKRQRTGARALFISGYTADVLDDSHVIGSEFSIMEKPFAIDDLLHKIRWILDQAPDKLFVV